MTNLADITALIEHQGQDFNTVLGRFKDRFNDLELQLGRQGLGGGAGAEPDENLAQRFLATVRGRPVAEGEFSAEQYQGYRNAFTHYIRRGEGGLSGDFRNALSVGNDPEGGYFTTEELRRSILKRQFETSPMRELASAITIMGDALKLPIDPNDAISGGWVGEKQSRPATATSDVAMQRIEPHEQYAYPEVSQSLLDDSFINIEQYLGEKIADKLIRTENTSFVTGNGVMQPRGFLNYAANATTEDDGARAWGVLQYAPSGAAGGFPTVSGSTAADPNALIDLQLKLKPDYLANAVWLMRRSTAGVVRKLKDADGRYLWLDNLTEGGRPLLLGHPVILAEDMPAVASDSFSIAFGDFRAGYLIVDKAGIRVLRDPYTNKPFVGFYTTKRTGGDVTDFDAIKLMKFAAS